jgi:3alpha(or 20beta)-hydroxysteroid dehydrogenase
MRFQGRYVVVTGAARGQGAEEARLLAEEGATVLLTDVLEEEGQALAAEIGRGVSFLKHDVASEADWAAVAQVVREWGALDGLVNNAGIFRPTSIAETSPEQFDWHYQVNQRGSFLGLKLAEEQGRSGTSVVNISSLAGLRASRGVAYTGTKWALRGISKTAAVELGPRGIRVNSVHPGIIDTPMLEAWTPEQYDDRLSMVPLRRAGTVTDVARLVLFLLSDESAYITGAEIAIDGGLSA